jgi:hypothetical protein
MRCTQFIGLTLQGDQFVRYLTKTSNPHATTGMFGEKLALGAWIDDGNNLISEVEQFSVWSSGIMIFTCLKKNGERFCEWVRDPDVCGEVDYPNGTYNV